MKGDGIGFGLLGIEKAAVPISVLSLTENTLSYDCPGGQVMSYDWLCQVMSDCVALRETEGNHIITFAFGKAKGKLITA